LLAFADRCLMVRFLLLCVLKIGAGLFFKRLGACMPLNPPAP